MKPFSGCDRNTNVLGGFGEGFEVVGRDRLLDPAWLVGLEIASDANGRRGTETPVHLDEQLDIRPHGPADRFHEAHAVKSLFSLYLVVACAKGIELEREITLGDGGLGRPRKICRRSRHLI